MSRVDASGFSVQLVALGVSTLYEGNGQRGWIPGMTRIAGAGCVAGPAVTAVCAPGDNLGLLMALDVAAPGSIVVAVSSDPTRRHTFLGDMVAEDARRADVAGVLVDGLVRDVDSLQRMGLGVWATGVAPFGPRKDGPGSVGETVTIGLVRIEPGDWIVMDGDGALCLPAADASGVAERALARATGEERARERIRSGEPLLDVGGLRERAYGKVTQ